MIGLLRTFAVSLITWTDFTILVDWNLEVDDLGVFDDLHRFKGLSCWKLWGKSDDFDQFYDLTIWWE